MIAREDELKRLVDQYRDVFVPIQAKYLPQDPTALITSLKDGMNLVAKEFCAAQVDERGVVIISEFAGATAELQQPLVSVNPVSDEPPTSPTHRIEAASFVPAGAR